MWRSVCALIAAAWFFAGLVFVLNPLVGFGFLALAFVDWADIIGDLPTVTLRPDDSERPPDD